MQAQIQGQNLALKHAQVQFAINMGRLEQSTELDLVQTVTSILQPKIRTAQESTLNTSQIQEVNYFFEGLDDLKLVSQDPGVEEGKFAENAAYFTQALEDKTFKSSIDGPGWAQISADRNSNYRSMDNDFDELQLQFQKMGFSKGEIAVAQMLALDLNEKGFIEDPEASFAHIQKFLPTDTKECKHVFETLRSNSLPAGLFAKDLKDNFYLQVNRKPMSQAKITAMHILDHPELFESFINGKKEKLAGAFSHDNRIALNEGLQLLAKCHLYPRTQEEEVQVKSVNRSVEADFQARLVGDRFTISMNNKVSQYILDTLRKSVDPNSHLSRSMDRVSKSDPYFQKLVEDRKKVLQCMDMIQLRRKQQYKLVSYLVEYQKEFLLDPEKTPKPLLMKEVAEKFGMSESSISRLASRKAIEIDGTVLSIRTFFSLGVRTDDGNRLSYEEMNKAVNSLINSEEVAQNDSDLAKGLKEAGINVSENQVKNIREQFGIPDRNERQEINSSRQQSLGF